MERRACVAIQDAARDGPQSGPRCFQFQMHVHACVSVTECLRHRHGFTASMWSLL